MVLPHAFVFTQASAYIEFSLAAIYTSHSCAVNFLACSLDSMIVLIILIVLFHKTSPQKRKFEPDSTEYKLTNQSKIVVTKNLTFPWADMSESNKQVTVQDIYDTMTTGDVVSIKAKVVWKGEMETVCSRSMRKELTKCEVVLADFTGAIIATIWEDTIPHVCDQKSCLWSNFKVGFLTENA